MIRLKEVVPFSKADTIEKGLRNKYKDLDEGTFGVEIEVHTNDPDDPPTVDPSEHIEDFEHQFSRSPHAQNAYEEWVNDERESDNRRYRGDNWDDSHGPVDTDTWEAYNPSPERLHYPSTTDGGDEQYEDDINKWKDAYREVESDYTYWERFSKDDYISEWISQVVSDGTWDNYFEVAEYELQYQSDAEFDFVQWFENNSKVSWSNSGWDAGQDADDIMEVRTPPLKYTEENIDFLGKAMYYLYNTFYPAGDTSAHVHVGMDKDSTIFDLLAATTLVDEKAIKQDISADRELERYAALTPAVHRDILRAIKGHLDKTGERKIEQFVGKSFTVDNKTLQSTIDRVVSRNSGTNIKAFFRHKTLEFRYFSSQIAPQIGKFQRWIKYFMLLPKVARGRNQFIIGKGKDFPLVFTREGKDNTKITILDKDGKMPKAPDKPADHLRADKDDLKTVKDLLKQKFSDPTQMKFPFAKLP